MCIIGEGEEGTLLEGGLVRLKNGDLYYLSDCQLKAGGKLILGVGIVRASPKPKPKPKVKGEVIFDNVEIPFVSSLMPPTVVIETGVSEPPPAPRAVQMPYSPFAIIGVALVLVFKKLSGLDRELKSGSCPIRHQEAITRIAKLEGKVLRKQVIDGGKKVKEFADKRREEQDKKSSTPPN